MPKNVIILGSTGSVGRQTLDVIASQPDQFRILALTAGQNLALFNNQIHRFRPEIVVLADKNIPREDVKHPKPLFGVDRLNDIVSHPDADIVVIATPGKIGLLPTLEAIRAGKCVVLSNKEVLVMAGGIVLAEAQRYGIDIHPVDSEHSALWQCMQGENKEDVFRLWLTASGGPFRDYSPEKLNKVTSTDALHHPNWSMGQKVTIDSATLMNKGFEVIEAHWLFGLPYDNIRVIIHPESIIHSMIEFVDGSIKAQMGAPDMRLPILYALTYPKRLPNSFRRVDWTQIQSLNFSQPDLIRFPCLGLAFEVGKAGETYPAVLSAADEIAVESFLKGRIDFNKIADVLRKTLDSHDVISNPTIEDILIADEWGRRKAISLIELN